MTGTFSEDSFSIFKDKHQHALSLTFTAGTDLVAGQEVFITGNLAVSRRASANATSLPIGVVEVGSTSGNMVTVRTNFQCSLLGIASGATLTAGNFVKPTGAVDANGRPLYVVAATGDYAQGVVLKGGIASAEIIVGVLNASLKV